MRNVCIAGLFIIFSISFIFNKKDDFQKVIDKQPNSGLKKKLIIFREQGIEKLIYSNRYSSEKVIEYAFSYLNVPHKMGGVTRKGMDCSGLVMVVHEKYGIALPHSSQEQARYGEIIGSAADLKRGDLVFFYDSYRTSNLITHSGIYLGENKFIHTSNSKGVVISRIDDPYYWSPRFLFGTRLQ